VSAEGERSDQAQNHVLILGLSQRIQDAGALGKEVWLDFAEFSHLAPNIFTTELTECTDKTKIKNSVFSVFSVVEFLILR